MVLIIYAQEIEDRKPGRLCTLCVLAESVGLCFALVRLGGLHQLCAMSGADLLGCCFPMHNWGCICVHLLKAQGELERDHPEVCIVGLPSIINGWWTWQDARLVACDILLCKQQCNL